MATSMGSILPENLREKVKQAKLFVVGAGGIGCELIKNLVLTGFEDIELVLESYDLFFVNLQQVAELYSKGHLEQQRDFVKFILWSLKKKLLRSTTQKIDLDTIDVSNLNRQFLFRKEHVGKSKAQVAKESALRFNPNAKIVAHQDNIMSTDYGVDFFKKFTVIMNALDNRAARNHVNRMCLAADIPLIESGTAGYLGQVTVIKKGDTECYECKPKPAQKTFPGCTIRNTPSEPIHCIVWAKHLFNQLFGEDDPDQDVSPDTEDPEAAGEAGAAALETDANTEVAGGIERKSTKLWAQDTGYDAEKIFHKLFRDDIKYLLSMENLWKKRRPPTPLDLTSLPDTDEGNQSNLIHDQRVLSMKECVDMFKQSVAELKEQFNLQGDGGMLVWDKDDKAAMDFVTATANIRAYIYGIPRKSRFDIKSMAGNIIPAIATTNAIIAGLIVMEAFKILTDRFDQCRTVYLNRQPNPRKKLLNPCVLDPRNPKCYVCSEKPEVTLVLNTTTATVKLLEEKVLKAALGMVAPDVEIDDGKGTILISSEEGETEGNANKVLSEFHITNGTRLKCDDFLQVLNLNINIAHVEKLEEEKEFEVLGDLSELKDKVKKDTAAEQTVCEQAEKSATNGAAAGASNIVEEDDLMVIEEGDLDTAGAAGDAVSRKRKADDEPAAGEEMQAKKRRSDVADIVEVEDDEVMIV